jgi:hypothetical protein
VERIGTEIDGGDRREFWHFGYRLAGRRPRSRAPRGRFTGTACDRAMR